jgi:hypothetical protein
MKRNPHRLADYITTHEANMERLRSGGFVGVDTLAWERNPRSVRLFGEIACLGDIVITVDKTLEIVDGKGSQARILGRLYSYNVHLRNGAVIFRYDNLDTRAGHADAYHKHIYGSLDSPEGHVAWVGIDRWPTLGDVIEEARVWREANLHNLKDPDAFPTLGMRGK